MRCLVNKLRSTLTHVLHAVVLSSLIIIVQLKNKKWYPLRQNPSLIAIWIGLQIYQYLSLNCFRTEQTARYAPPPSLITFFFKTNLISFAMDFVNNYNQDIFQLMYCTYRGLKILVNYLWREKFYLHFSKSRMKIMSSF